MLHFPLDNVHAPFIFNQAPKSGGVYLTCINQGFQMTKFSNRSQGFSLIELLLVLAIIAALAVAAFIIYPRVQAGRQATFETQVLSSAQASVKSLFTQGDFRNLTTAAALNGKFFPDSYVNGAALNNQFGGTVTAGSITDITTAPPVQAAAAAAAARPYFGITYTNVPSEVCVRLAGGAAGNFGAIVINGNVVKNAYLAAPTAFDEAAAALRCNAAATVPMIFISN